MDYFLIAAGVNVSPAQTHLNYAEKDAEDFHCLMTSAVGPKPQARLLTGLRANRASITTAFLAAVLARPRFFVFFFSGHGNQDYTALGDGLFHHSDLIDLIRLVDAPHTLIILDVCRAASFWDHLKEASVGYGGVPETTWFDALAQATPSTRMMFSTGRARDAGERRDLQNGLFTRGLINTLLGAWPTVPQFGPQFVSDAVSFNGARRFVMALDPRQTPMAIGLTGDFPMVLSEHAAVIGEASVERTVVHPHHVDVVVRVADRDRIVTRCLATLFNVNGKLLDERFCDLLPSGRNEEYTLTYSATRQLILSDLASRVALLRGDAPLTLRVRLLDGAEDTLDQHFLHLVYRH